MPQTGRAAVFVDKKLPFDIREYPIPDPAADDMVIRITRANVCGTDIHLWRGDTDLRGMGLTYGVILGHEMTGRVHRLGKNVGTDSMGRALAEGDRVVYTYYAPCGHCRACAKDLPHLCLMSIASPLRPCDDPPHFLGGFADYYYLNARQRVFKVPDEVSDSAAAGANCALSQVIHGLMEGKVTIGESVVVQGAGGLGLFACAVAKEMGAQKVIAIDGLETRLAMAKQFGADEVISLQQFATPRERIERVNELTGGWGADVVVEVAGIPDAIPEGVRMLARGGRYLEMGCVNPKQTYKADPSLLSTYNRTMLGISLYPPFSLQRAVDFLARTANRYPFDSLTRAAPLAEISRVFEDSEKPVGTGKPVTRAAIVME